MNYFKDFYHISLFGRKKLLTKCFFSNAQLQRVPNGLKMFNDFGNLDLRRRYVLWVQHTTLFNIFERLNQSGALLFSVGNHGLLRISIPDHFQSICLLTFLLVVFLVHPTSSHAVFPCCVFLRSFQSSQNVLVSLYSTHGQKKSGLVFAYSIYEGSGCVTFL